MSIEEIYQMKAETDGIQSKAIETIDETSVRLTETINRTNELLARLNAGLTDFDKAA